MGIDPGFPSTVVLLGAGVAAYYGWAIRALGRSTRPLGRRLLDRLTVVTEYTADEVESLVSLLVAAAGQLLFVIWAFAITDLSIGDLAPARFDAPLLLLGAVLGVGEAGLASFLGYATLSAWHASERESSDPREWVVLSQGGWIRSYLRTAEILPWPLLLAVAGFYVSTEELFFRGVLITFVLPNGAGLAVVVSTVLFILVQVFHMPSWRAGLFPAIGGLIVGVVHGVLFVVSGDLTPLIVAHLTMFLVFVW